MAALHQTPLNPSQRAKRTILFRNDGKSRKELVFAIVLISVGLLFAAYLLRGTGKERPLIVKEGDRAPAFSLQAMDRRAVSLSDYRGKVVFVHFWATWCPPCVEEMPKLEQLYRRLFGKDFEILAVNVDEGGGEALGSFFRKNPASFPVLLDPGGSIAKSYGTFKFPETYVVDRAGTVRFKVIGPLDWMAPETVTALSRLIEEK